MLTSKKKQNNRLNEDTHQNFVNSNNYTTNGKSPSQNYNHHLMPVEYNSAFYKLLNKEEINHTDKVLQINAYDQITENEKMNFAYQMSQTSKQRISNYNKIFEEISSVVNSINKDLVDNKHLGILKRIENNEVGNEIINIMMKIKQEIQLNDKNKRGQKAVRPENQNMNNNQQLTGQPIKVANEVSTTTNSKPKGTTSGEVKVNNELKYGLSPNNHIANHNIIHDNKNYFSYNNDPNKQPWKNNPPQNDQRDYNIVHSNTQNNQIFQYVNPGNKLQDTSDKMKVIIKFDQLKGQVQAQINNEDVSNSQKEEQDQIIERKAGKQEFTNKKIEMSANPGCKKLNDDELNFSKEVLNYVYDYNPSKSKYYNTEKAYNNIAQKEYDNPNRTNSIYNSKEINNKVPNPLYNPKMPTKLLLNKESNNNKDTTSNISNYEMRENTVTKEPISRITNNITNTLNNLNTISNTNSNAYNNTIGNSPANLEFHQVLSHEKSNNNNNNIKVNNTAPKQPERRPSSGSQNAYKKESSKEMTNCNNPNQKNHGRVYGSSNKMLINKALSSEIKEDKESITSNASKRSSKQEINVNYTSNTNNKTTQRKLSNSNTNVPINTTWQQQQNAKNYNNNTIPNPDNASINSGKDLNNKPNQNLLSFSTLPPSSTITDNANHPNNYVNTQNNANHITNNHTNQKNSFNRKESSKSSNKPENNPIVQTKESIKISKDSGKVFNSNKKNLQISIASNEMEENEYVNFEFKSARDSKHQTNKNNNSNINKLQQQQKSGDLRDDQQAKSNQNKDTLEYQHAKMDTNNENNNIINISEENNNNSFSEKETIVDPQLVKKLAKIIPKANEEEVPNKSDDKPCVKVNDFKLNLNANVPKNSKEKHVRYSYEKEGIEIPSKDNKKVSQENEHFISKDKQNIYDNEQNTKEEVKSFRSDKKLNERRYELDEDSMDNNFSDKDDLNDSAAINSSGLHFDKVEFGQLKQSGGDNRKKLDPQSYNKTYKISEIVENDQVGTIVRFNKNNNDNQKNSLNKDQKGNINTNNNNNYAYNKINYNKFHNNEENNNLQNKQQYFKEYRHDNIDNDDEKNNHEYANFVNENEFDNNNHDCYHNYNNMVHNNGELDENYNYDDNDKEHIHINNNINKVINSNYNNLQKDEHIKYNTNRIDNPINESFIEGSPNIYNNNYNDNHNHNNSNNISNYYYNNNKPYFVNYNDSYNAKNKDASIYNNNNKMSTEKSDGDILESFNMYKNHIKANMIQHTYFMNNGDNNNNQINEQKKYNKEKENHASHNYSKENLPKTPIADSQKENSFNTLRNPEKLKKDGKTAGSPVKMRVGDKNAKDHNDNEEIEYTVIFIINFIETRN